MGIIHDLESLLFPRICPVCRHRMQHTERHMCASCLAYLPRIYIERTDDNEMARLLWPTLSVEHAAALFHYNSRSVYRRLIHKIKRPGGKHLAIWLGRLAAMEMENFCLKEKADVMIPVPLTRKHRWRRGYNQSAAIAQGMSEITGLPVCDCIKCNDRHKEQKRLNADERKKNSVGTFTATIPPQYRGKRILLVDDMFTTGATMTGCALSVLENAPGTRISIFTLTRA